MDIKKIRGNEEIIKRVEELLQTAYTGQLAFNEALNGDEPVILKSLKDKEVEYKLDASEILFWADRDTYMDELESWEGEQAKDSHREAIEFLKRSDQAATFLDMTEAIRKKRIAPFVGAGLSLPCGYPLWRTALEKIAYRLQGIGISDINVHLQNKDYLKAAQVLFDAASVQVENYIRTEFAPKPGQEIAGTLKLLSKITHGCIVTTNFDELIEQVFKNDNKMLDGYMHGVQMGNNFVQRLLRGDRCILKLHGNALDRQSYVFTENQYLAAYGNPFDFSKPLPRALRQIFVSHSLLFLGCSLEQDKTLELFKHVIDENHFDIPEHYAILPEPGSKEEKIGKETILLGFRIHPIWYVADDQHSYLEKLLSLAVAIVDRQVVFS